MFLHTFFQFEDKVPEAFTYLLQTYYGSTTEPRINEAIDYVQKNVSAGTMGS